jgi:hypothetical protein
MNRLPLFSVGEVVILQSVTRPEINGEDTVIGVYKRGDLFEDRFTKLHGTLSDPDSLFSYRLKDNAGVTTNDHGVICEAPWRESALRKKHQPGEMSFSELVSSLKIGEKV